MTAEVYVIETSAFIQAFIEDSRSAHMHTLIMRTTGQEPIRLHILDFGLSECLNILDVLCEMVLDTPPIKIAG